MKWVERKPPIGALRPQLYEEDISTIDPVTEPDGQGGAPG